MRSHTELLQIHPRGLLFGSFVGNVRHVVHSTHPKLLRCFDSDRNPLAPDMQELDGYVFSDPNALVLESGQTKHTCYLLVGRPSDPQVVYGKLSGRSSPFLPHSFLNFRLDISPECSILAG